MNLKSVLSLSVMGLLITTAAVAAPGKVYKWTDSKGQTHYSQHPPLNTETQVIKTQAGHSDPVDYSASSSAAEKKPENVSPTVAPAKDKERCEMARKNAETLKTYARIRIKGDDGEFRYITPDEHAQKLDEANKAIEESCE